MNSSASSSSTNPVVARTGGGYQASPRRKDSHTSNATQDKVTQAPNKSTNEFSNDHLIARTNSQLPPIKSSTVATSISQHENNTLLFDHPSDNEASFVLDPSRDKKLMEDSNLPYVLQGNEDMYTIEAVQARRDLYRNLILRIDIRNLARRLRWIDEPGTIDQPPELMTSAIEDSRKDAPPAVPFPGVHKVLEFKEYSMLYHAAMSVLQPDATKANIQRHLEMDWIRDQSRNGLELTSSTKGSDALQDKESNTSRNVSRQYITWRQFYDAVFELIDQWSESTKLIEYRSILRAIDKALINYGGLTSPEGSPQ